MLIRLVTPITAQKHVVLVLKDGYRIQSIRGIYKCTILFVISSLFNIALSLIKKKHDNQRISLSQIYKIYDFLFI